MKTFDQQKYPTILDVVVVIGRDVFGDVVKGLNVGHALWRASQNWPGYDWIQGRANFERLFPDVKIDA